LVAVSRWKLVAWVLGLVVVGGGGYATVHCICRAQLPGAVESGDLSKVKRFLSIGVSPNTRGKYGSAVLHTAASRGHADIAKLLLDSGADVNVRLPTGGTALHMASDQPAEVAELLLSRGAEVDATNDWGRTPLHAAVDHGNLDVATLLLAHGADPNAKDHRGVTPVHEAASDSHMKLARLLLDEGGECPVEVAAMLGDVDEVRKYLDAGANIDARLAADKALLHWVALSGETRVARLLIARGADVNVRDDSGGTPLYSAELYKHVDLANLLLDHGADPYTKKGE
jgi:ankyrin repeat protein